jgi:hypothetical protein
MLTKFLSLQHKKDYLNTMHYLTKHCLQKFLMPVHSLEKNLLDKTKEYNKLAQF